MIAKMTAQMIADTAKTTARSGLVVTTAMSLVFAPLISAAQASTKVGITSAVIPEALIGDTPAELKLISVGDRVDQDVTIETGTRGRTQVLFIDGSSMNIGPNSRIVIDKFVFDPSELSGNLGARIEKGSMRFIGGVLSKRSKQVEFDAGDATVGIRGGIAKLAVQPSGALRAELVHGRLSITTPQGVFETSRIGTLIERDSVGSVATRTISPEEAKQELDEEAKEGIVEVTTLEATAPAPEAPVDPVDAGLVEVSETGEVKAAAALVEADPEAARLVDEGAIAVDDSGKIAPTEKMLEVDETARKMFDEGLIKVNEDGFLVPAEDFDAEALYAEFSDQQAAPELVSELTLTEFDLEEPERLSFEKTAIQNSFATRQVLSKDTDMAEFYESGLVEVGADGKIAASQSIDSFFTGRVTGRRSLAQVKPITYVSDKAADKFLLDKGFFDAKTTTRVLGSERASAFYSSSVTRVLAADIVRDDTINAIEKLASANQVKLDTQTDKQSLKTLIEVGSQLSGLDKMRAVLGEEAFSESRFELSFSPGGPSGDLGAPEASRFEIKTTTPVFGGDNEPSFNEAGGRGAPELTGLTGAQLDALKGKGVEIDLVNKFIPAVKPIEITRSSSGFPTFVPGGTTETRQLEPQLPVPGSTSSAGFFDPFPTDDGYEPFPDDDFTKIIAPSYEKIAAEPETGGTSGLINLTPVYTPEIEPTPTPGIEAEETVADTRVTVIDESKPIDYSFYASGMRETYDSSTTWGSDGPDGFWRAFNSDIGKNNVVTHFPDNKLYVNFTANSNASDGVINQVSLQHEYPDGYEPDLLDFYNEDRIFSSNIEASAGSRANGLSSGTESYYSYLRENQTAELRADSGRAFCDCNFISTGLWDNTTFNDRDFDRLSYKHVGHYAIGAPVSVDLIQSLAGKTAIFQGHAVATITHDDGTGVKTGLGYGRVDVQLDYANPRDGDRNYWQLSELSSSAANYSMGSGVQRVSVAHGTNGRYTASTSSVQVDGGVHGVAAAPGRLETGGTFAINDPGTTAITGSFVAAATSVEKTQ